MRFVRRINLSPPLLAAFLACLAGAGILLAERRAAPAPAAPPPAIDRTTTSALPPASSASHRRGQLAGPVEAKLERVIDGDTFEARVRVWFGQDVVTLVRLRGIDAPELKAECAQELDAARRARGALEELLASGRLVLTEISDDKYFGRVVARVTVAGEGFPETDVSGALIAAGHARAYSGGKRAGWCETAAR